MSLVVEAYRSLSRIHLLRSSNAFTVHVPTTLSGRDKVQAYVERVQTRLEHPTSHTPKSLLDGQLLAVKDNIWTAQFPTTCASAMLRGYQSPIAANVVNGLEEAGMVVVGKTNMDEFGMGSHSMSSHYGPVKNDTGPGAPRSAGGSSGGSAMAVANKQCRVALGTDTGGSVRLPAAYTALIGYKPSYGRLSRSGVVPYANSLDTVGIIGSDCEDIIRTYDKMNRSDVNDPTCINDQTRRRIIEGKKARFHTKTGTQLRLVRSMAEPNDDKSGFPSDRRRKYPSLTGAVDWTRTIGVPVEYNIEEMSETVREAWVRALSQLEAQGHTIVPISLPHTRAALSAYYVLAPAEASSNLAKYDGVRYGIDKNSQEDSADAGDDDVLFARLRGKGFGAEVQRRILLGNYSLSSTAKDNYFIQAQKVRRLVQRDFDRVFKIPNPLHNHTSPPQNGVDYIISPTAPTPPPRPIEFRERRPHSEPQPRQERQERQREHFNSQRTQPVNSSTPSPSSIVDNYTTDLFTVPASLAGLPAVSIPAPLTHRSQNPDQRNIGIQILAQYGDDLGLLKFVQQQMEPGGKEKTHYGRGLGLGRKRFL